MRPWHWKHLGVIEELDIRLPGKEDLGKLAHAIRASWRSKQWSSYVVGRSIASHVARNLPYEEKRLQLVRKYIGTDGHRRMIATGSWDSPSHAMDPAQRGCPWCGLVRGTADHVMWTCAARPSPDGGPLPLTPTDGFMRRMGWAVTSTRKDIENWGASCLALMAFLGERSMKARDMQRWCDKALWKPPDNDGWADDPTARNPAEETRMRTAREEEEEEAMVVASGRHRDNDEELPGGGDCEATEGALADYRD